MAASNKVNAFFGLIRDRARRDPSTALLLFVFPIWFLFNWSATVNHIARYYNPLPIWDYWRIAENLASYQAFDFRCLWRQHNEHRIVFPEIVFALDQLMFRGRQLLPTFVSFACYASVLALFSRLFWRDAVVPKAVKTLGVLFAGIVFGWPLSTFVLGSAFLLQWTLLQLAAVVALLALSKLNENFTTRWLTILILGGTITTFSSANGLLLWPLLVAMAALLRWHARQIAAIAIPGAICIATFFLGYRMAGSSLLEAIKHPLYCLGFIVSYLSMPFGAIRSPLVGFAFGTIGLGLWVFCLIRTSRRPSARTSGFALAAFGYTAFVLLTAAITCTGRIDLTNAGFLGAKAGRYVTLPLVVWAVLILVLVRLSWEERWKRFSPRMILILAALIVGFMEIRLARWLRTSDYLMANQQFATLSIENGLLDPSLLQIVFPNQTFIERYLPLLRSSGNSIFSEGELSLLGQTFSPRFRTQTGEPATGGVLRLTPVRGGSAVFGWASNLGNAGRRTILLVDGSGTVVGLGRHLAAGLPAGFPHLTVPASRAWVAFVNSRYESTSFVPYDANLATGEASLVSGTIAVP